MTIATNMAGRGTDIVLGGSPQTQIDAIENPNEGELKQIHEDWRKRHEQVLAAGGLHIIGTERHESRRIDNQLRGRSGRQGDPGSSRFYLSLEDNLMRIFGDPTRMKALMTRVGMKAGEAIESGMLTRQIERAQRRVEQHNFDARKQLLEYDDVANDQRARDLPAAHRPHGRGECRRGRAGHPRGCGRRNWSINTCPAGRPRSSGMRRDWHRRSNGISVPCCPSANGSRPKRPATARACAARSWPRSSAAYGQKEISVGPEVMRYIEKEVMLRTLDQHWREHLAAMDYMRQGIFLRSYAQKNPKQEYKREAFELFSAMLDRIKFDTVTTVSKIQVRSQAEIEREELERQQRLARALRAQHAEAISPIQAAPGPGESGGDGRKFRRQCHGNGSAPDRSGGCALRARRAQGGTQRTLPLRIRPQVQALPRRPAASERLSPAKPRPLIHVVAAAVIDAMGRVLIAQRPTGKHLAGGWEFPGGKLEAGEERLRGTGAGAARRARHPHRGAGPPVDPRAPRLPVARSPSRCVGGAPLRGRAPGARWASAAVVPAGRAGQRESIAGGRAHRRGAAAAGAVDRGVDAGLRDRRFECAA